MQEVVKLELVPEQETVPVNAEYNARILANKETEAAPAFEIQTANATIRFYNGTDPGLIETVTIARQQAENDKLKSELAWFRQKFFGSSGERRTCDVAGQMSLFGVTPEEEKPVELIEPEVVTAPKRPRKAKPSLEEQFKDIPTRQVVVDTLSDEDRQCPLCGTEMVPIGTELIRSEIVYTPPKLERANFG